MQNYNTYIILLIGGDLIKLNFIEIPGSYMCIGIPNYSRDIKNPVS